jgi:uncharacterized damage-inducible protein DinB
MPTPNDPLAAAVIAEARQRLDHLPRQVRACLEALSEEQIWWRPHAQANSVGNLVLHLVGSTRHFVGRGVGGSDYRRDRPAEFAERGPRPRAELLRLMDEGVAEADGVLAQLGAERLLEVSERAGDAQSVLGMVLRTTHHWAVHCGQIVYAAKLLQQDAVRELWMKTLPR